MMNPQDEEMKSLLRQLAIEGKISPGAAGMGGDMVMPAMEQEPLIAEETTALPEVNTDAPVEDLSTVNKPEKIAEYNWPSFPLIYNKEQTTPELFDAVQYVESEDLWDAVSASNAIGLMQAKPQFAIDPGFGAKNVFEVAEELGVDISNISRDKEGAEKLLYMPEVNRKYGEGYLQAMVNEFGDVATGLVAYNYGPGDTKKWLAKGGNWQDLREESRNYLNKIERTLNGEDVYAAPN